MYMWWNTCIRSAVLLFLVWRIKTEKHKRVLVLKLLSTQKLQDLCQVLMMLSHRKCSGVSDLHIKSTLDNVKQQQEILHCVRSLGLVRPGVQALETLSIGAPRFNIGIQKSKLLKFDAELQKVIQEFSGRQTLYASHDLICRAVSIWQMNIEGFNCKDFKKPEECFLYARK